MSTPNTSVLWSVSQSLTDAQKLQARTNIGAAAQIDIIVHITDTWDSVKAIYDAGNIPVLLNDGRVYQLTKYIPNAYFLFSCTYTTGSCIYKYDILLSPTDGGTWSDPHVTAEQSCIPINFGFSGLITVALTDSYEKILECGDIELGAHGTSGGGIVVGVKRVITGSDTMRYEYVHYSENTQSQQSGDWNVGSLSYSDSEYSTFLQTSQYDGTATQTEACWKGDISTANFTEPGWYRFVIRKYFDGTNTKMEAYMQHVAYVH